MLTEETRQISLEDIRSLRAMHRQQTQRLALLAMLPEHEGKAVMREIFTAHAGIPDLLDVIEYQLSLRTVEEDGR